MLVSSPDGAVSEHTRGLGESQGLAGILTPYRGSDSSESSALTLVVQPLAGPSVSRSVSPSRLVAEHMDPGDHPWTGWTSSNECEQLGVTG